MVVGQTGGGKSVILQTLARSQTKMGKRTTMSVLNPKVSHDVCGNACDLPINHNLHDPHQILLTLSYGQKNPLL